MFGSRKSRNEMSVEEFVTGQSTGVPVDDGVADEREDAPRTRGWLIAAIVVAVGLLVLCFTALVKISYLSREVALLRSQMDGKTLYDLKAQVATLGKELEVMKQANTHEARAKTKMAARNGTAGKKKIRSH